MYPNNYFMSQNNYPILHSNYLNTIPKNHGLFSHLSIGLKNTNWSNLLGNANKTLNLVNQTIPLVKQVQPMVNNMRSVLRLAKAFGKETNETFNSNHTNINRTKVSTNVNSNNKAVTSQYSDTASLSTNPTFFI